MSAADAAPTPLSKVDSAVQGLSSSPPKDETKAEPKRRASSSVPGVYNILDLGMWTPQGISHALNVLPIALKNKANVDCVTEKEGTEIQLAKETQKLNW
jgi:hypothetical protein